MNVAARAGVARIAPSYVLGGARKTLQQIRCAVQRAMEELGDDPRTNRRPLQSTRANVVALPRTAGGIGRFVIGVIYVSRSHCFHMGTDDRSGAPGTGPGPGSYCCRPVHGRNPLPDSVASSATCLAFSRVRKQGHS
jgi:hypothetical protein